MAPNLRPQKKQTSFLNAEISGSEAEDEMSSSHTHSWSSTPDSEEYFSDPESDGKKRKRSHSQVAKKTSKKVCSVVTAIDSRTTKKLLPPASLPLVVSPGIFSFLPAEWYQCRCLMKSPTSHALCHVLGFFELWFHDAFNVIVCNTHDSLVPMSHLAVHLSKRHDWKSSTKSNDVHRIVQHIAQICCVKEDQSPQDVLQRLPSYLDAPLVPPGSNRWKVENRFPCPLPGCGHWEPEDKRLTASKPDGYIKRHLRDDHGHRVPQNSTFKCSRTHRMCIAGTTHSHIFILPSISINLTDESTSPISTILDMRPSFGSLIPLATLQLSGSAFQEWPSILGWVAYEQEISANTHVIALRRLILPPICTCSPPIGRKQHSHFLDEGLHQCRHALLKYLELAVSFAQGKHKKVSDILVSRYVIFIWSNEALKRLTYHCLRHSKRAIFRPVKRLKKYAEALMCTICLMLRFLHMALTEGTSTLGSFKLRGDNHQFRAALELYRLLAEHQGNPPEDALGWRLHELLTPLWKSEVRGGREISSPTDQVAFIWAFQPGNLYKIPSYVQSFLVGMRYDFRCIALNHMRVTGENLSCGTSPFYHSSESEQDDPGELTASDESDTEMDLLSPTELETYGSSGDGDIASILAKLDSIMPECKSFFKF